MADDERDEDGWDQCEHCKEDYPSDELICCEECNAPKCEGCDDTSEKYGGVCEDCLLARGIQPEDAHDPPPTTRSTLSS